MNMSVKRATRDERGAAYVLTLVLLLVGGLIMGSLLGHMGTGIIAGEVHEKRTDELYASDAGVEEAIRRISNPPTSLDPFELDVNDKHVDVDIDRITCGRYRIESKATTEATTAETSDTTTTTVVDYWMVKFLDNAITSRHDVKIENHSNVYGRVWYGGELTGGGEIHGEVVNEEFEAWPEWEDLYNYYYTKYVKPVVDAEPPYPDPGSIVDIKDTETIGPIYRQGNLTVKNNGNEATLTLEGTMYVTGDLDFEQPGAPRPYTIDLNGHTIFVEGKITFPAHRVTVAGSGNIIAVWDIDFQPAMDSDEEAVLLLSLRGDITYKPMGKFTGFIMAVEGEVEFKPMGDFAGSVAGVATVDLEPHVTVTWIPMAELDIDFPFDEYSVTRIRSWNIITDVQTDQ